MNIQIIFFLIVLLYALISIFIFRYFLTLRFRGDRSPFFVLMFIIFSIIVSANTLLLFDYSSGSSGGSETNIDSAFQ